MGAVDSGEHHSNSVYEMHTPGDSRWRVPAWAIGWIILALLFSTIPYVAGLVNTPSGSTFTGSLLNSMDTFSYYSKIQSGLHGKWCFNLRYSAGADITCGPFYMLFLAFGHIAGLTRLSIPLVYHGARVICGALLGVAMLQLAFRTLSAEREQRLALALVLFTGGWGWLVIVVAGVDIDRNLIMDLWRFEANGPGTLAGFPHFALVVACQIWLVLAGLSLFESRRSWRMILVAVFSALGISVIHPQQLVIPGVILGVAALQNVRQAHPLWRSSAALRDAVKHGVLLIAIFLLATSVALAQWIVIQREPYFQEWLEAGVPSRVPLIGVLSLFGPIMPLALLGVWCVWQMRDMRLYPVVIWLVL